MRNQDFFLALISLLLFTNLAITQTNNEQQAQALYEKAIKLMDEEQKYDEAIEFLKKAQEFDPETIVFPYEISYSYYLKKDYKQAIEIAETLVERKDVFSEIYRLIGNSYDLLGEKVKAIEWYEKGLDKFPNEGTFYHELGVVEFNRKNTIKAVKYFENGVNVDPDYATNYYELTKIFCNTTEKIWGILYGEIFMQLEANSKRTKEISKLLFDTYFFALDVMDGKNKKVSFSKNVVSNYSANELPFSANFEMNMALCIIDINKINLKSLNKIRECFIKKWFKLGLNDKYPNILFDWQKKALDKDYFKTYNYWLLSKGAEDEFDKWVNNHKEDFTNFAKWYVKNTLELSNKNCFLRTNYSQKSFQDSLKMNWKTKEDYINAESKVLNLIKWLEVNPFYENDELRKYAAAYVLTWFAGAPYITLNVNSELIFDDNHKEYDENGLLLTTYMYAKGAYLIEHKDSPDEMKANIQGIESTLNIYDLIIARNPEFINPLMVMYKELKSVEEFETFIQSRLKQ